MTSKTLIHQSIVFNWLWHTHRSKTIRNLQNVNCKFTKEQTMHRLCFHIFSSTKNIYKNLTFSRNLKESKLANLFSGCFWFGTNFLWIKVGKAVVIMNIFAMYMLWWKGFLENKYFILDEVWKTHCKLLGALHVH